MDLDDTLRDRLSAAAGAVRPSVPDGSAVRRSAVRHRVQRRVLGGSAILVAVAAAVLAGSTLLAPRTTTLGPATPSPTVTGAPAPTPSDPVPTSTAPPLSTPSTSVPTVPSGPPPLTRDEAQRVVADLRFPAEQDWHPSSETPVTEIDDPVWSVLACPGVPFSGTPLAARTVVHPQVDWLVTRQVVVYEDGASAASAFSALRARMRACHAEPVVEPVGGETWTTTVLGGQLALADDSFWVAEDMRITESPTGDRVGQEQIYTEANLLVLDDNVVVSISDPAWRADGRERFVEEASAEWEQFRPAYEDLRRS